MTPILQRRLSHVAAMLLAWVLSAQAASAVHAQAFGDDISALEQEIHDLTNSHRLTLGQPSLGYNETIATVARQHSRDVAWGRVGFGHEGADTRQRALARSIPLRAIGENVALTHDRRSRVAHLTVEQWLESPGHRQNIEGDYNLTGVGIVRDPNGTYTFTQIFLFAVGQPSPTAPSNAHRPPAPVGDSVSRSDPRRRSDRKRVPGGWVQALEPDL